MDVFDVYQKTGEAIDLASQGQGPILLEALTYRFLGHFVGDRSPTHQEEVSSGRSGIRSSCSGRGCRRAR